jgi:hypothetical protein
MPPITAASDKAKKGGGSSDFKHRRAKVGKRALKPVNYTDTTVKAASLHVRSQDVVKNGHAVSTLLSSRGKSLDDVARQLQHPADAVRLSAAKGLCDMIQHAHSSLLREHVSTIFTLTGRCLADADSEIRFEGRQVLLMALHGIRQSAAVQTSASPTSVATIVQPFLPLIMAFVLSALNSLDHRVRRDGGIAAGIIAQNVPSIMRQFVPDLIPCFIRLLSDRALYTQSSQAGVKKRKQVDAASSTTTSDAVATGSSSIMEALVAVLRAPVAGMLDRDYTNNWQGDAVDLSLDADARKRNALFLSHSSETLRRRLGTGSVRSLSDYKSLLQNISSPPNEQVSSPEATAQLSTVVNADHLLRLLRDVYMEETQNSSRGLPWSWERFRCIVECIKYFWQSIGARAYKSGVSASAETTVGTPSASHVSYHKTCLQVLGLLRESFASLQGSDSSQASAVSGEICSTIVDMCFLVEPDKNTQGWVADILQYIRTSLRNLKPCINQEKNGTPARDAPSSQGDDHSLMLLDVVRRLMRSQKTDADKPIIDATICKKLAKEIAAVYFMPENVDRNVAVSPSGRAVVTLVGELLESSDYDLAAAQQRLGSTIMDMLQFLPTYLSHWEGGYLDDSARALKLLLECVRRLETNEHVLLVSLRGSLTELVKVQPRHADAARSTFEALPPSLQSAFLNLVGLVEAPSSEMLHALSDIVLYDSVCSGTESSADSLGSRVLRTVHLIRRSISLQEYVGFLVDSCSLADAGKRIIQRWEHGNQSSDRSSWFIGAERMGPVLKDVCHNFIGCGTKKVLSMMTRIFEQNLIPNDPQSKRLVYVRWTTVLILAMFSADLSRQVDEEGHSRTATDFLGNSLTQALISTIQTLITNTSFSESGDMLAAAEFYEPIVSLFETDTVLFDGSLDELGGLKGKPSEDQAHLLNFWIMVTSSRRQPKALTPTIRQKMHDAFSRLMVEFKDGPHEQATCRLMAQLLLVDSGDH